MVVLDARLGDADRYRRRWLKSLITPPRGINGPIDDILFPIQHGMLHYPGFKVLPPFVTYRAGDEARFALCEQLGQRLDNLWNAEPIRFRRQNAGDYLIPQLTLKAHLAPGQDGFGVHIVAGCARPGASEARR